MNESATILNF